MPTQAPIPGNLAARLKAGDLTVMAQLGREIPGFASTMTMTTDKGTFAVGHVTTYEPTPSSLVAVAQLRAADIPDLPCPAGTDLLQVLWCPNEHSDEHFYEPAVQLRWRAADDVADPLGSPPLPIAAREQNYLPRPCVLHPEQVTEYPWWQELPVELGQQVRDFDDSRQYGELSYFSVSQAPGWKAGGYASWELSDLIPMDCPTCHCRMDLLLTISSNESSGGLWQPVEESHLQPSWTDPEWMAADKPTGITVGRHGKLRIFACMRCPGTPFRQTLQ